MPRPQRVARYYAHIKQQRQALLEQRRGLWVCDRYMLLDLQRWPDLNAVLDVLERHMQSSPSWNVLLEPLLDQLRQQLPESRRLLHIFLQAGVAGASFRWLETQCGVSRMLNREPILARQTQQLWHAYLQRAVAEDELIWFPAECQM